LQIGGIADGGHGGSILANAAQVLLLKQRAETIDAAHVRPAAAARFPLLCEDVFPHLRRAEAMGLRYDLVEDNLKEANIAFWLSKHIGYAELHAREELSRRREGHEWLIQPSLFGSPDQRVVWCKRLWYQMPLYARPFFYFVYRYLVLRGILDGKQGFIFHFLQSFWYRLLVDIRLDDMLAQQSATSNS